MVPLFNWDRINKFEYRVSNFVDQVSNFMITKLVILGTN